MGGGKCLRKLVLAVHVQWRREKPGLTSRDRTGTSGQTECYKEPAFND